MMYVGGMSMKKYSKMIDIILYIIVVISLTAAISSALWDRPMLFTSIRSNSMYPLFKRSDIILINSISNKDTVQIGDIVVFKVENGMLSSMGWIVHRIIDGNDDIGYITKGDANDYTDQATGGTGPIQREWIVSKVLTLGENPVKIPLLGYLPLWMENIQSNPYIMPFVCLLLAIVVGTCELMNDKKRKKKKKSGLELQLVYFIGGVTVSIIMGVTMLATSERIVIPYEVSNKNTGILMGSNIGVLTIDDEIKRPLTEIDNKGIFPIITTITTDDEQITFNTPLSTLKKGDTLDVEMTLIASTVGTYNSTIHIGMFYPFLPSNIIYKLSKQSYWIALSVVSIIPGLPLMLYPLIDKKLRNKTIKEIRRKARRIYRSIPMIN